MTNNGSEDLREYIKFAIKVLALISILMIYLAAVTGCSTKKHVEKTTDIDIENVAEHSSVGVISDESWWRKYIDINSAEDESVEVVVYDTTLPVDPKTNRPPVKADIRKTSHTEATISGGDELSDEHSELTVDNDGESVHEVFREQTNETKETPSGFVTWKLYLFLGIVIGCTFVALWGKHLIQDGVIYLLNKIFR